MFDVFGAEMISTDKWEPRDEVERQSVREQLERILRHGAFRNSTRCPMFLRYVVEHALREGNSHIKERTVGAEVFGREADYDTAGDTVVRTTAADVRRRIAQYYHEPGHENELRIDLPPGSYMPEFRLSAESQRSASSSIQIVVPSDLSEHPLPLEPSSGLYPVSPGTVAAPLRRKVVIISLISLLALIVAGITVYYHRQPAVRSGAEVKPSDSLARSALLARGTATLNLFWGPVLAQPNTILECVDSAASSDGDTTRTVDAIAAATLGEYMGRNGKPFKVRSALSVNVDDVHWSTTILVGAGNKWISLIRQPLRFYIAGGPGLDSLRIEDRKAPSGRGWTITSAAPKSEPFQDYAIIARFKDPDSGQWVIIAAGIGKTGTETAAEFLIRGRNLGELVKKAPKGWESKNIEAVIATPLVNGTPGMPEVVDVEEW